MSNGTGPITSIPAATLDILDAHIPDAFTAWQSYPDAVRFKSYREEFCTDPVLWQRHQPPQWAFDLKWEEFRYADISTPAVLDRVIKSKDPGLYIFYIRPEMLLSGFPTFALYVGISNESGSSRPLRERLKDYLPGRISGLAKRTQIDSMIRRYYGVLRVAYSLINRSSADLEALEETLHGFIYPRYDRRDWPVDIKTQQKAFGLI